MGGVKPRPPVAKPLYTRAFPAIWGGVDPFLLSIPNEKAVYNKKTITGPHGWAIVSINLHTKNFSSWLYYPPGQQRINKFK